MSNSSIIPVNKRSEVRKVANQRGRIVFTDKRTVLDCTIVDTSTCGARIRLSQTCTLPAQTYLLNVRDRTVHFASVVWGRAQCAGLQFLETHVLGSDLPSDLDFMRKQWLECTTW